MKDSRTAGGTGRRGGTAAPATVGGSSLALQGVRRLVLVMVGVGLLTASAYLSVPFYPVPLTMQTLAVLLIGGLLGPTLGASSVAGYLALGAAGAPVFHNGLGGAAVLVGPPVGTWWASWPRSSSWGRRYDGPLASLAPTLSVMTSPLQTTGRPASPAGRRWECWSWAFSRQPPPSTPWACPGWLSSPAAAWRPPSRWAWSPSCWVICSRRLWPSPHSVWEAGPWRAEAFACTDIASLRSPGGAIRRRGGLGRTGGAATPTRSCGLWVVGRDVILQDVAHHKERRMARA